MKLSLLGVKKGGAFSIFQRYIALYLDVDLDYIQYLLYQGNILQFLYVYRNSNICSLRFIVSIFSSFFWIVGIIVLEILRRKFIKFYDDYFFVKKDGEQKSISFKRLIDKSEFDLYFEDQTRSMDFAIDGIRRAKGILKLYDRTGEEKDSIQILWYRNRWEIFTEFLKELKYKTANFFRKFRRS